MTYAFLIALIVGLVAAIVLVALWQSTKQLLMKEKVAHDKTKNDLQAATAGLQLSEAGRSDEKVRLEALVVQLKKEIDTLASNVPHDPAAVRGRLNELLGAVQPAVPVPGPGAGTGPLGAMPYGSAPKP